MKVLVAEDNPTSRLIMTKFIKQMGYIPIYAKSGHEAMEMWSRESPRFVITDWNMPDGDGIDLVRYIRENNGDLYTYIIMITARDNNMDLIKGFEAGVDDYLTKPVNREELFMRMKAGERVLSLQDKDMIIFAMAKLTEARDMDTGNHIERIRCYSRVLAERLYNDNDKIKGITGQFIENIYETSPLHDIGKVGIEDRILQKPGKLTKEEFEIMKKHTLIGYDTLNSVFCISGHGQYLKMAADIARSHHEKWDGTGYPDGLKGEDIPLSARIVALADVYDALTTKRVYKEAYSHDTARRIIKDELGRQFDPRIVDAFFQSELEFIRINRLHK